MEDLLPFVSKEALRFWMAELQYQNGYIYATDAFIMVRKQGAEIQPEEQTKYNLSDWFDKETKIGEISKSEVVEFLNGMEKTPIYWNNFIDCDECDSDGEVECNYGHYHECPDCNGQGRTGTEDKTKIVGYSFNENQMLQIYYKNIPAQYIEKVMSLNLDRIEVFSVVNKPTQAILQSNGYEILLMGRNNESDVISKFV